MKIFKVNFFVLKTFSQNTFYSFHIMFQQIPSNLTEVFRSVNILSINDPVM